MSDEPKSKKPTLTTKQRAFVNAYLSNGFNGTRAAIEAGYSEKTARTIAAQNLAKLGIREEIDVHMKRMAMSADETLARLTAHARGDMREFIDKTTDELKEHPAGWLIKKYKRTVVTGKDDFAEERVEIELYDAQAALEKLARHHNLLIEKKQVDLTSGGKPITPVIPMTPEQHLAAMEAYRAALEAASGDS